MKNPVDFAKLSAVPPKPEAKITPAPKVSAPSRPVIEAKQPDVQISVKGPENVIQRFKEMCNVDPRRPYSYWHMLEILMDEYENKK